MKREWVRRTISYGMVVIIVLCTMAVSAMAETNAATSKSDAKSKLLTTGTDVTRGKVRLCAQATGDKHFVKSFWKGSKIDISNKAGGYCNRASFSMAMSYLGIDCTPVHMQELGEVDTSNYYTKVLKNVNAEKGSNVVITTKKKSYSESVMSNCYKQFDTNSNYSPIYIWGKYNGGKNEHAMIIVGKESENNGIARYIVVNPSSKSCSEGHVGWLDVNTSTGKCKDASVSAYKDYEIKWIFQWRRDDVTLSFKTLETMEAVFAVSSLQGAVLRGTPDAGGAEKGKKVLSALLDIVAKVENGSKQIWYKTKDGAYVRESDVRLIYKVEKNAATGIYTANQFTQRGSGPFDAKGKGKDLQKGSQVEVIAAVKNTYGNLWYRVKANDGYEWVYSGHLTMAKQAPTVSGAEYSSTQGIPSGKLTKGKNFGLRGNIKASEKITSVVATVYDLSTGSAAKGLGTNPVTVKPNATSLNIKDSDINKKLKFSGLGDGAYRYEVKVTTASGTFTLIDSQFTVGSGVMPAATPSLGDVSDIIGGGSGSRFPGDADGDGKITMFDAMLTARKACGHKVNVNVSNCDVDQDGKITMFDAMLIARKACGHKVTLK